MTHPFADYNKYQNQGVLVGNWVEETALKTSTGTHRYQVGHLFLRLGKGLCGGLETGREDGLFRFCLVLFLLCVSCCAGMGGSGAEERVPQAH
mmetsp:Transcript_6211/g.18484  ORF Transcript_6211/g.18484 Transcript_6211/m.18484 type:complete len:93 (+) Transcript_6211:117-395(+)